MKIKRFFSITIILSVLCLTSCIDSVQSVSYKNGQYIITSRFTMSKDMISTLVSLGESDTNDLDYAEDLEDYVDVFGNILGDSMTSKSPKLRQEVNELYKSLRDSNMFPAGGYTSKVDTNSDYRGKSLTFYDVGEMWCIELPFSFLSEKNSISYKYIVMYF